MANVAHHTAIHQSCSHSPAPSCAHQQHLSPVGLLSRSSDAALAASATSPPSVRSHGRPRRSFSRRVPGCMRISSRKRARSRNGSVSTWIQRVAFRADQGFRPRSPDVLRREAKYRWAVRPHRGTLLDESDTQGIHRTRSVGQVYVDLLWVYELPRYLSRGAGQDERCRR